MGNSERLGGATFNQTTSRIKKREGERELVVVRKESSHWNPDLIKEVEFLIGLDKELKPHFPKVLKYQTDKLPVFYEMEFYDLKTMRKSVIDGEHEPDYYISVLRGMLEFMFSKVYSKNAESTEEGYIQKTVFSRIEERYKELREKSSIFKSLIDAEKIVIEGREYDNVLGALEKIRNNKELVLKMTPKKMHMVHGDFHFDNFLIDARNPGNFVLIDPRGERRGYCYSYDLGKLWFSFHGKYDLTQENLFDLDYEIKNNIVLVKKFGFNKTRAQEILDGIYDSRNIFLEICKKYLDEENIEEQILFAEATHFCALAEFNLKNDGVEKEAIGRYLTAVKLINEIADKNERI